MKSIKKFKQFELSTKNIFGGKLHATDNNGRCDTWNDADNDGSLSPGDTICYDPCEEEILSA